MKRETNLEHYSLELVKDMVRNHDQSPLVVIRRFALEHGADQPGFKMSTKDFVNQWANEIYGTKSPSNKKVCKYKKLDDFKSSGKAITDYLKPSDLVENAIVEWSKNNLELANANEELNLLQFYDVSTFLDTYITFQKDNDETWEYCGRCEKDVDFEWFSRKEFEEICQ